MCIRDSFNPNDSLRPGSHRKPNGSNPAVEINHRFCSGQTGVIGCKPIKAFGLSTVYLVKGERGELKYKPAKLISNGRLAKKQDVFFTQNDIICPSIDV